MAPKTIIAGSPSVRCLLVRPHELGEEGVVVSVLFEDPHAAERAPQARIRRCPGDQVCPDDVRLFADEVFQRACGDGADFIVVRAGDEVQGEAPGERGIFVDQIVQDGEGPEVFLVLEPAFDDALVGVQLGPRRRDRRIELRVVGGVAHGAVQALADFFLDRRKGLPLQPPEHAPHSDGLRGFLFDLLDDAAAVVREKIAEGRHHVETVPAARNTAMDDLQCDGQRPFGVGPRQPIDLATEILGPKNGSIGIDQRIAVERLFGILIRIQGIRPGDDGQSSEAMEELRGSLVKVAVVPVEQ